MPSEFAEKIKTIGVVGKTGAQRDKELSKDLDAYYRLRKEGLQPPSVDGSALLEQRAVTKDEIQTGAIKVNGDWKSAAKERRDAMQRGREASE